MSGRVPRASQRQEPTKLAYVSWLMTSSSDPVARSDSPWTIGVELGLQSSMPNLFKIFSAYARCDNVKVRSVRFRWITTPRKNDSGPRSRISNFEVSSFLIDSMLDLTFPTTIRSSTYTMIWSGNRSLCLGLDTRVRFGALESNVVKVAVQLLIPGSAALL